MPALAELGQQREPGGGPVVAGWKGPGLEQSVPGAGGQPLGARRLVEASPQKVVGEGLLLLPPPPFVRWGRRFLLRGSGQMPTLTCIA